MQLSSKYSTWKGNCTTCRGEEKRNPIQPKTRMRGFIFMVIMYIRRPYVFKCVAVYTRAHVWLAEHASCECTKKIHCCVCSAHIHVLIKENYDRTIFIYWYDSSTNPFLHIDHAIRVRQFISATTMHAYFIGRM